MSLLDIHRLSERLHCGNVKMTIACKRPEFKDQAKSQPVIFSLRTLTTKFSVPKNSQNPVRWVRVSRTLKFSRSVSEGEQHPSNFDLSEWVSQRLTHAHSRLASHFFENFQKKFFWLKNHYFDLFNLSWPTKWTKQFMLNCPNDASSRQKSSFYVFFGFSFKFRFYPF